MDLGRRHLVPEWLDSMDPADPRAKRSRWDLRLVNGFLGNERWITTRCRQHAAKTRGIVELGAGEGHLSMRLHNALPKATITGLDLAARPRKLPSSIAWIRGNFFEMLADVTAETCVGNLILHHFHAERLSELGRNLQRFRILIFSEPFRDHLPLMMAGMALPLAGEVTRHDMPASIRSGFRKGELPRLLGLDPDLWKVEEKESRRGSLRVVALRP